MRLGGGGAGSIRPRHLAACGSCGLVAALSLSPTPLQAEPALEVVVDCPPLDAERRAAVEARVRADLLVKRLAQGRLTITCGTDQATVQWRTGAEPPATETAALADSSELVDQLLALALQATSRPSQPPRPAAAEPGSAPQPEPVARAEPAQPAVQRLSPPAPAAGHFSPSATRPLSRITRLSLSAGASAEAWSGDLAGAFGPRLGLGVSWEERAGLELVGAVQWAPQQSEGVSATQLEVAVESRLRVYGRWWLSGAVGVSDLRVSTELERSEDSEKLLVETAWLAGRGAFDVAPLTAWVGPELHVYSAARIVRIEGRDVFSVPAVTAALGAGLTLTP
jgi:hypothetical protein